MRNGPWPPDCNVDSISNQPILPPRPADVAIVEIQGGELVPFDEGLQPGELSIPLLGDAIEVFLDLFDRFGIEFEPALAARADAAHEFCAL